MATNKEERDFCQAVKMITEHKKDWRELLEEKEKNGQCGCDMCGGLWIFEFNGKRLCARCWSASVAKKIENANG